MVDRERLARLPDRALAGVTTLTRFRDTRTEPVDAVWLAAVKYTLVTAIEGCGRIAHHLVASEGWPATGGRGVAGPAARMSDNGMTVGGRG